MLMKNARFYMLPADFCCTVDDLQAALKAKPFVPCGNQDWEAKGWIPPLSCAPDLFVIATQDILYVALQVENKVLPAKVLQKELDTRVGEVEQKEARKMGRKEKAALKEQITDELLPKAFTTVNVTRAYIDTKRRMLLVDASVASTAEALISALREALPPFPAALPRMEQAPYTSLTSWLNTGELPEGFELGDECELEVPSEKGALIKAKNHDLQSEEIKLHLEGGKQCFKLGLLWAERMAFVLTHELAFNKIQYLDVLQEEISQQGEDMESLAKAEILMMVNELGSVIDVLLPALGGLQHEG